MQFLKLVFNLLETNRAEIFMVEGNQIAAYLEPGKAARPTGMFVAALAFAFETVNPPGGVENVVRRNILCVDRCNPAPRLFPIIEDDAGSWVSLAAAVVLPDTPGDGHTARFDKTLKVQVVDRSEGTDRIVPQAEARQAFCQQLGRLPRPGMKLRSQHL